MLRITPISSVHLSVYIGLIIIWLVCNNAGCISALKPASTIREAQKAVLDILTSSSYSDAVRPGPSANATLIRVSMFVWNVDRVDDLQSPSITLQLTLRQMWFDPRLVYKVDSALIEYVTLDDSHPSSNKLWTPDILFGNEASAHMHSIMKPNSYKRVFPNGEIMWSTWLTATLTCPMDFFYFPFDNQVCAIRMESFSLSKKDLMIRWEKDNPVAFLDPRQPSYSKFDLKRSETGHCDPPEVIGHTSGKFSCIFFKMYLKRQTGAYASCVYMPMTMCVFLSWITFWLGQEISTRLSLTLTLLLTMATQTLGMNQGWPQVSYAKAVDIWSGCCMSFGALAILETAIVAYFLQQKQNQISDFNRGKMSGFIVQTKANKTLMLDKVSRILFPTAFGLYAVGYFSIFVVGENYPTLVDGGYQDTVD